MWNSSELYLSILGGVLAGFALVLVELIWRLFYALFQKHRTIREIRGFFSEWEKAIATSGGIDDPEVGISRSKEEVQFAQQKYYLRILPIKLLRWEQHASAQQIEAIRRVAAGHEHAEMGIIPPDKVPTSQNFYTDFFDRVRDTGLKW